MREPRNEFGRELRKLRRARGFSQARLAELAGVTASYLSQLETGERRSTPGVIRRLSPHLEVSPNHLFARIGMVEMDLAGTLADNREYVNRLAPGLTREQAEEMANYLTYLDFKKQALKGTPDAESEAEVEMPDDRRTARRERSVGGKRDGE
jgi:transcriptional regulator with XRE-family HTH domain